MKITNCITAFLFPVPIAIVTEAGRYDVHSKI